MTDSHGSLVKDKVQNTSMGVMQETHKRKLEVEVGSRQYWRKCCGERRVPGYFVRGNTNGQDRLMAVVNGKTVRTCGLRNCAIVKG